MKQRERGRERERERERESRSYQRHYTEIYYVRFGFEIKMYTRIGWTVLLTRSISEEVDIRDLLKPVIYANTYIFVIQIRY